MYGDDRTVSNTGNTSLIFILLRFRRLSSSRFVNFAIAKFFIHFDWEEMLSKVGVDMERSSMLCMGESRTWVDEGRSLRIVMGGGVERTDGEVGVNKEEINSNEDGR